LDSTLKLYCAATFQVLFIASQFSAWNITTVEMNNGVYLRKRYICQVLLFISGGFGLVLILVFWSWS